MLYDDWDIWQSRKGLDDEGVVQGGGGPTVRKHGMERHQKPLPARGPAQAGQVGESSGGACSPNGADFVEEIRRFMLFRGERYPEERGAVEGEAFLIPLAVKGNVPSPVANARRTLSCSSTGRYREREPAGYGV